MLEEYFVKPQTVDRIRASWIGAEIECYVAWMAERGYRARNVPHRVPLLVAFGEFARAHGAGGGGVRVTTGRGEPWISVPVLGAVPEPSNLVVLKGEVGDRWGTLEAKAASEAAAAAGLGTVPVTTATRIVTRYAQVLDKALAGLPAGPPPRRKHTGGRTHVQREAWNLATRMRRHQDQVLRLLVDTRMPFYNNEAERSLRMAKLHDKISGCFRSVSRAEAFLAVRSYLQTGRKHNRRALDLLVGLWTAPGGWLPATAVPDTG